MSETWLIPSIFDSELFGSNNLVYRSDKPNENSVFAIGGGVLVAVKSEYASEVVIVPNSDNVEFITVKISFAKFNCIVCCVYISSDSSQITYFLYVASC